MDKNINYIYIYILWRAKSGLDNMVDFNPVIIRSQN